MFLCSVEFVPRYIKTSGNATVDHLSKYLAVRLALEELRRNAEASPVNVEAASEKQYTIYIPTAGNQYTVSKHTSTNDPNTRNSITLTATLMWWEAEFHLAAQCQSISCFVLFFHIGVQLLSQLIWAPKWAQTSLKFINTNITPQNFNLFLLKAS